MAASQPRSKSTAPSHGHSAPVPTSLNSPPLDAITALSSRPSSPIPSTQPRSTTDRETPGPAPSRERERSIWRKLKTGLERIFKFKFKGKKQACEPFYDDWNRYIKVEAQIPGYPVRPGVAMIDPQCPEDLIAREFAELLCLDRSPCSEPRAMETLKGEPIKRLSEVKVRWHFDQKNIPLEHRFNMDNKFEDGTFIVTDANNRFDVIIGIRTIQRLDLLGRNSRAAPFFRGPPPQIEGTVQADQAKADAKRKKELEDMEREQDKKDKKT